MSPSKLGRSRDVSEQDPVKFKNIIYNSRLAAQVSALPGGREGNESAPQVTDLIGKSPLTGHRLPRQLLYVFSGEHRTAYLTREACLR
jgi:hypothetical protein